MHIWRGATPKTIFLEQIESVYVDLSQLDSTKEISRRAYLRGIWSFQEAKSLSEQGHAMWLTEPLFPKANLALLDDDYMKERTVSSYREAQDIAMNGQQPLWIGAMSSSPNGDDIVVVWQMKWLKQENVCASYI